MQARFELKKRKLEHSARLEGIYQFTVLKMKTGQQHSNFACAVLHTTCVISHRLRETVCRKMLFSEMLTVLLVVALVPIEML